MMYGIRILVDSAGTGRRIDVVLVDPVRLLSRIDADSVHGRGFHHALPLSEAEDRPLLQVQGEGDARLLRLEGPPQRYPGFAGGSSGSSQPWRAGTDAGPRHGRPGRLGLADPEALVRWPAEAVVGPLSNHSS